MHRGPDGAQANATVFMAVHAAFAVLLSRLSGTADISVGTPIAGRGEATLDDVVGMFVNTLALRTEVEAEQTFRDLLDRAREADLEAFAHADVPFERLVEVLTGRRWPTRRSSRWGSSSRTPRRPKLRARRG